MAQKILIVDDMKTVRMLCSMILREEGFELEEADNGFQAVLKVSGAKPPDLILMDVMMPGMNGIECCRMIRKQNETIPIVMLTTKGEEQFVKEAKEAGCNAYLTKPINKLELVLRVKQLLKSQEPKES